MNDSIDDAVTESFSAIGFDPESAVGLVPLDRIIRTVGPLLCHELPSLTLATIRQKLLSHDLGRELPPDPQPIAGFLYACDGIAVLFASADDPISRRRFTFAHELGHYLLHARLALRREPTFQMKDTHESLAFESSESNTEPSVVAHPEWERQANRFAAELLMPAALVTRLHEKYAGRDRVRGEGLAHLLASDLLVSREAVKIRMTELGLTDTSPVETDR